MNLENYEKKYLKYKKKYIELLQNYNLKGGDDKELREVDLLKWAEQSELKHFYDIKDISFLNLTSREEDEQYKQGLSGTESGTPDSNGHITGMIHLELQNVIDEIKETIYNDTPRNVNQEDNNTGILFKEEGSSLSLGNLFYLNKRMADNISYIYGINKDLTLREFINKYKNLVFDIDSNTQSREYFESVIEKIFALAVPTRENEEDDFKIDNFKIGHFLILALLTETRYIAAIERNSRPVLTKPNPKNNDYLQVKTETGKVVTFPQPLSKSGNPVDLSKLADVARTNGKIVSQHYLAVLETVELEGGKYRALKDYEKFKKMLKLNTKRKIFLEKVFGINGYEKYINDLFHRDDIENSKSVPSDPMGPTTQGDVNPELLEDYKPPSIDDRWETPKRTFKQEGLEKELYQAQRQAKILDEEPKQFKATLDQNIWNDYCKNIPHRRLQVLIYDMINMITYNTTINMLLAGPMLQTERAKLRSEFNRHFNNFVDNRNQGLNTLIKKFLTIKREVSEDIEASKNDQVNLILAQEFSPGYYGGNSQNIIMIDTASEDPAVVKKLTKKVKKGETSVIISDSKILQRQNIALDDIEADIVASALIIDKVNVGVLFVSLHTPSDGKSTSEILRQLMSKFNENDDYNHIIIGIDANTKSPKLIKETMKTVENLGLRLCYFNEPTNTEDIIKGIPKKDGSGRLPILKNTTGSSRTFLQSQYYKALESEGSYVDFILYKSRDSTTDILIKESVHSIINKLNTEYKNARISGDLDGLLNNRNPSDHKPRSASFMINNRIYNVMSHNMAGPNGSILEYAPN